MPYSAEQFFAVFNQYNSDLKIYVAFFYLLAFLVLWGIFSRKKFALNLSLAMLACLWLWMGIVYQIFYFSKINPMAKVFGAFFILQGFIWMYAMKARWFQFTNDKTSIQFFVSLFFIAYALLIYPILGMLMGHGFPSGPVFSLPCPSTIFTFGIVLLLTGKGKHFLAIMTIPVLWSVIGTTAAFFFGVREDYLLAVSALGASILLVSQVRNQKGGGTFDV